MRFSTNPCILNKHFIKSYENRAMILRVSSGTHFTVFYESEVCFAPMVTVAENLRLYKNTTRYSRDPFATNRMVEILTVPQVDSTKSGVTP